MHRRFVTGLFLSDTQIAMAEFGIAVAAILFEIVRPPVRPRPPSDPRFVPAPRAAKLPDEISISPKGAPFKPFPQ